MKGCQALWRRDVSEGSHDLDETQKDERTQGTGNIHKFRLRADAPLLSAPNPFFNQAQVRERGGELSL